jgi:hypothetical protein
VQAFNIINNWTKYGEEIEYLADMILVGPTELLLNLLYGVTTLYTLYNVPKNISSIPAHFF